MPMIGARFYTQLDEAHKRNDVQQNELAKVSHTFDITVKTSLQSHGDIVTNIDYILLFIIIII